MDATSATGARFTLMPSAPMSSAAWRAMRPAAGGALSVAGLGSGAANGTLRIDPPSWSVEIRALPPAACCSDRVSARSCDSEAMLSANRITPAASPLRRASCT